jgi:hypothetical protein
MNTKHTFTKTFVIVALSLALSSCKKTSDDPTKNSGSTNTELLTSSTWKLSKIEYLQKDGTWINGTLGYSQEGATLSVNTDNTYNTFATNISAASGTWKFSADFEQLSMVNNKTKTGTTFSVNTLNKTTLQLGYSGTVYVYGGVDDLERFTYDGERDTFVH